MSTPTGYQTDEYCFDKSEYSDTLQAAYKTDGLKAILYKPTK